MICHVTPRNVWLQISVENSRTFQKRSFIRWIKDRKKDEYLWIRWETKGSTLLKDNQGQACAFWLLLAWGPSEMAPWVKCLLLSPLPEFSLQEHNGRKREPVPISCMLFFTLRAWHMYTHTNMWAHLHGHNLNQYILENEMVIPMRSTAEVPYHSVCI